MYLIVQIDSVEDSSADLLEKRVPKELESPGRSKANSVPTEPLLFESSAPLRCSVEGSSLGHMSSSTLDSQIFAKEITDDASELSEMETMTHSQFETANTSPRIEDTAESMGAYSNLRVDLSDFGSLLSYVDSLCRSPEP